MSTLPPAVTADLRRLVESECLGVSLFAAAAERAHSHQHREAWRALHALEVKTQAGIASFIERTRPQIPSTNFLANTAGHVGGTGLQLLPYGLQLRAVRKGTTRYLPAFNRLARYFENSLEFPFFEYVVRHELAIIGFTSRALTRSPDALDPVLRLLDEAVPRI